MTEDPFGAARAIADAVLDEGHVLYPYRASAMKNRMRWQFGILGPPALEGGPGAEASWCRTKVVALAPPGTSLTACVRWLQPHPVDDGGWQAADAQELTLRTTLGSPPAETVGGGTHVVVRTTVAAPWVVVDVRVSNADDGPFPAGDPSRDAVLARSRVGVHTMLAVADGAFVSSVEPPPEAAALADPSENVRTWPVLVGPDVVLSCPVILYDQPRLAPEVATRGCDALEIEELLALRVATLTPSERREAAATDPVAGALVADRAHLDAEAQWALHGRATRRPAAPGPGEVVVLHPRRRADAQDMFLAGRTATVVGTSVDASGATLVRVIVDDDPGRDLHEWQGRSWFFALDELERR